MRETWVWSLVWEDPLEEEMATHSSTLAWRTPMDRGVWRATVHEVTESHRTEWLKAQGPTRSGVRIRKVRTPVHVYAWWFRMREENQSFKYNRQSQAQICSGVGEAMGHSWTDIRRSNVHTVGYFLHLHAQNFIASVTVRETIHHTHLTWAPYLGSKLGQERQRHASNFWIWSLQNDKGLNIPTWEQLGQEGSRLIPPAGYAATPSNPHPWQASQGPS